MSKLARRHGVLLLTLAVALTVTHLTGHLAGLRTDAVALTGSSLFLLRRYFAWIFRNLLQTLTQPLQHFANRLLVRYCAVLLLLLQCVLKLLKLLRCTACQLRRFIALGR